MNFDSEYIKNIIKANNDNSLAIFIGAGISKSSETKQFKLPNWKDLIDALKSELHIQDETDYLKIAQLYYLAFGEFVYYRKLKEYFPDYIKPSEIHKLIFDINPHIILTTNWDTILERTIEDNAYIYDTICTDVDLVKSSLQNKLIKIHGDFRNHNIVFKEDDYINYQNNFPLIENYVKSILSTHTVLFLGYSYNDINLKQILKWIQNHSKARPPMYLATFNHNETQSKYLENHGITTIVLNKNTNLVDNFDEYSNKVYTFLNRIKNFNETSITSSKEETIKFVLNKLKYLNDLEGILLEQIQRSLTNCGFFYDGDSKPILEFYTRVQTYDFNANTRTIYSKFTDILRDIDNGEKPSVDVLKIFDILQRAEVKGIILSKDDSKSTEKEYIPFSEHFQSSTTNKVFTYFDFDFKDLIKSSNEVSELLELAFKLYQTNRYEEAYGILEEVITLCLRQRNYTLLFVSMFNRNALLNRLKFDFFFENEKFKDIEEYNLKDRFLNLPKDVRLALEPIYDFIDRSFIYKYAYSTSEELKKKEDSKRTIEAGGMVFNSDSEKFSVQHENFLHFVLRNKIMIEHFNEYRIINKHYVKISLIRQIQREDVYLNKIELFSCIKYFNNKELKLLVEEFYKKDSKRIGKLKISLENKDWLINIAFENISKHFVNSATPFNSFEPYLENTILLLSLTKLDKDEIDQVLKKINTIINKGNNTINIFQAINLFLGIQYNLFSTEINQTILLEVLENLISKLVYKKHNGHEYNAITSNMISNLYGYAVENKAIFKNSDLINKLINEVKGYETSEIINISQNLLLNIYNISNQQIKKTIKSFILKIETTKEKQLYKKVIFELTLIIYNIKPFNDNILEYLREYLKQFESNLSFSTSLYTINNQIDYIIKNNNINHLNEISESIKDIIERHKNSDRLSIF